MKPITTDKQSMNLPFHKNLTAIALAAVVILAVSCIAQGAEYFVDGAKGDDKTAGSGQAAFRTIGAAIKAAQASPVSSRSLTEGENTPFSNTPAKSTRSVAGTTIMIRGGIYREAIHIAQAESTKENPFVIQGALGERVIITGFVPITNWKKIEPPQPEKTWGKLKQFFREVVNFVVQKEEGIYEAEVPYFIQDLYLGLQEQPVSRWLREEAMQPLKDFHRAGERLSPRGGLPDTTDFREIARDPQSVTDSSRSLLEGKDSTYSNTPYRAPRSGAQIFLYLRKRNCFRTLPLVAMDIEAGTLKTKIERNEEDYTIMDHFDIVNHPALIKSPGDWAVVMDSENKKGILHYKPHSKKDLQNTYYRSEKNLITVSSGLQEKIVSGVILRNLEVSGALRGIIVSGYKDVTIENCIVHNNIEEGVQFRRGEGATMRSNIISHNAHGAVILSSKNALIEGNEICYNRNDGLRIAGNISGKPDAEPNTENVTVRRNFIHHHLGMSHPDNIQTYRGVKNLNITENFLAFAGQNLMLEESESGEISNNVSVCSIGINTIFWRGANRWTVKNNTIGYSGIGALCTKGKRYEFFKNTIIHGWIPIDEETQSDGNYFITSRYSPNVIFYKREGFGSLEAATQITGTDKNSRIGKSPFANTPVAYAVAECLTNQATTSGYIAFSGRKGYTASPSDFAVGDNIEINGDGVMRKVTAVTESGIAFAPKLPRRPFRDICILNWGTSYRSIRSLAEDESLTYLNTPTKTTRSVQFDFAIADSKNAIGAQADGTPIGSRLDVGEFYRGELLEKNKRTLPQIPLALKPLFTNPNAYNIPLRGL